MDKRMRRASKWCKSAVSAGLAAVMMSFSAFGAPVSESAVPMDSAIKETVNVDPANPLGTELAGGLYSVNVPLEDGSQRVLYHYVPQTVGYRQPVVAIGVPGHMAADQFMVSSGWQTVAETNGCSLVLMEAPETGWAKNDSAYTEAVFRYMDDRTYLQTQDSAFYMVGYEDAADSVMAAALRKSEWFAGFAAFGVDSFDTSLLQVARQEESQAAGVMKSEVSVPVWIGAAAETAQVRELVDFWKQANNCGDEVTANAFANQIYTPDAYLEKTNAITYQDCSKVMVSIGNAMTETPGFTQYLYNNFLKRTRRQDSGDINALRSFATNEEKGMVRQAIVSEGVVREFYVYVPEAVASGRYQNVPVVFAFHGGGGSGEEFAARSGWDKVAEERHFIVVFPTGSRSNDKFKASTTWGTGDLPFFYAMRQFMLQNYPIDQSRIYVSGQSMGCVMSNIIALTHPEWIAACAATSARVMPSETENVNTSLLMPYMWSVGEKDKYFAEGGKDYGMVPACIGEWRARYGISADETNTYSYQNGNFHGYDFKNVQGVTLVREQWVTDKIHAMLPDEVYTLYDFLSCYSRGADGKSYYMGVEISPETR